MSGTPELTALPPRGRLSGLPVAILLQVALFSAIGTNFATLQNAFEVARLAVEMGLLVLALTPVIVTGGIDLSVGSLLGLAAVVLGKTWRDGGLPIPLAVLATVATGWLGGCFNGWLITRLRIPPLMATLGTLWFYRGAAEGLTGGMDNFTHLPGAFLWFGQGYLPGGIPVQLVLLAAAALLYWVLLHRGVIGRGWVAIGFSPAGALHAGIPVQRRLRQAYQLSGAMAGLAAVVYVAHVGQAKADAGTNYELAAVTAVVLGGTSISGGRGTIAGSLLGLLAITVLQNGLRLADLPTELAGILTGLLLLAAIGLDRRAAPDMTSAGSATPPEEFKMKNSQLAVLCGVILAAAAIIAGGNWRLAETVRGVAHGAAPTSNDAPSPAAISNKATSQRAVEPARRELTIAMMPKSKGNAYFVACRQGAEQAARELGVKLLWDGPTESDPAKQNEVVETWITRGVDVLAVSVENRAGLSTVLRKARQAGIPVVTWDADAEPDARDFFVNQATPEGIGQTLMDHAGRLLDGHGQFAIITASLTAANQNEWRKHIEATLHSKYPDIQLATVQPCDDQERKAFEAAQSILHAYPDVKVLMAICSPAMPGAAEAVKAAGRNDVKVVGLGLPNDNKRFVHDGVTQAVVLWNTLDLGYLTVHVARAVKEGTLKSGTTRISAGRLGELQVQGDQVLLGKPFTFDKSNIDQFDF